MKAINRIITMEIQRVILLTSIESITIYLLMFITTDDFLEYLSKTQLNLIKLVHLPHLLKLQGEKPQETRLFQRFPRSCLFCLFVIENFVNYYTCVLSTDCCYICHITQSSSSTLVKRHPFLHSCLSFLITMPDTCNLKKERFILAYSFQRFQFIINYSKAGRHGERAWQGKATLIMMPREERSEEPGREGYHYRSHL